MNVRRAKHLLTIAVVLAAVCPPAFGDIARSPVLGSRLACPTPQPGRARCFAQVLTIDGRDVHLIPGTSRVTPAGAVPVKPADLESAYGLANVAGGQDQTVAIVDAYDNPRVAADLAVYRASFSLPPLSCDASGPCFRVVNQLGGTTLPASDVEWSHEISLDVDAVSAVCPRCNILLVEANSNGSSDMFTAVETAVRLGATEVSMSWGGNEGVMGSVARYDSSLAAENVAFVAASGDSGFGDAMYPASSSNVIAVGGTTLRPTSNTRGWDESVWAGSGSGCSVFQLKPAWQKDVGCVGRTVADVSADGDPGTGLLFYNSFAPPGGWWIGGGTSLSAPIIAALIARGGGNHGSAGASAFYRASNINDVTRGSNFTVPGTAATPAQKCSGVYLCSAGVGYDAPTGVGTPDGPPR